MVMKRECPMKVGLGELPGEGLGVPMWRHTRGYE